MTVLLQVKLCASSGGEGRREKEGKRERLRLRPLPAGGQCVWRLLKGNVIRVFTLLLSHVTGAGTKHAFPVSYGC